MKYTEQEDFSQFGKAFQENLCQLIFGSRTFSDQMKEVLDINFLEFKYLQVFVKLVFSYKEKYSRQPSESTMATLLRTELASENELIIKQIRDFYARMSRTSVQDEEYIKDVAVDFCKKQVLKEAILKSVPLLKKSSFDDIQKLINDAMKLGNDNDNGYYYIKDFDRRFEIKARDPVTTGWKIIDGLTKGGNWKWRTWRRHCTDRRRQINGPSTFRRPGHQSRQDSGPLYSGVGRCDCRFSV